MSADILAANVVIYNFLNFIFQVPAGIGYSVSSLVGGSLGEGKSKIAYRYLISSIFISIVVSVFFMAFSLIFRKRVAIIYTEDEKVMRLVSETIPYFVVGMLFDNVQ